MGQFWVAYKEDTLTGAEKKLLDLQSEEDRAKKKRDLETEGS